jgi:hypothetical protein
MFYSPTKEFVRFSTYRTAEIKALKERIQKEKVTPEEITATQMRLEKLKGQYELLQQENVRLVSYSTANSEMSYRTARQPLPSSPPRGPPRRRN